MFSVRLVCADSYQAAPLPELDPTFSEFRGSNVKNVPIIRVFGTTSTGEKTCLHLHGAFPYLYVPFTGEENPDGLAYRLAASLDAAINIALGSATSNTQHVYQIQRVAGIPFYGYHKKEHQFFKILFYNPAIMKKATDLLLNGAVLNQRFQPHEAHIPFILQFMMDYNVHGMSLIKLSRVKHRRIQDLSESTFNSNTSNNISQVSDADYLPGTVDRQSICKLEVDALVSDILNREDLEKGLELNPGLDAIWKEERMRRAQLGLLHSDSQLVNPKSPPRPSYLPTESDKYQEDRLKKRLRSVSQSSGSVLSSTLISSYPVEVNKDEHLLNASNLTNSSSQSINKSQVTNDSANLFSQLDSSISQATQNTSTLDADDLPLVDLLLELGRDSDNQECIDEDSIFGTQSSTFTDEKNEINIVKENNDDGEVDDDEVDDLNLTCFEIDSWDYTEKLQTQKKSVNNSQKVEKMEEEEEENDHLTSVSSFPQFDGAGDLLTSCLESEDEENIRNQEVINVREIVNKEMSISDTKSVKYVKSNHSNNYIDKYSKNSLSFLSLFQNSFWPSYLCSDEDSLEPYGGLDDELDSDFDYESNNFLKINENISSNTDEISSAENFTNEILSLDKILNGDPCFTQTAEMDKSELIVLQDQYESLLDSALVPKVFTLFRESDNNFNKKCEFKHSEPTLKLPASSTVPITTTIAEVSSSKPTTTVVITTASSTVPTFTTANTLITTVNNNFLINENNNLSSENVTPNIQEPKLCKDKSNLFISNLNSITNDNCKELNRLPNDNDVNCNVVATWEELQDLKFLPNSKLKKKRLNYKRNRKVLTKRPTLSDTIITRKKGRQLSDNINDNLKSKLNETKNITLNNENNNQDKLLTNESCNDIQNSPNKSIPPTGGDDDGGNKSDNIITTTTTTTAAATTTFNEDTFSNILLHNYDNFDDKDINITKEKEIECCNATQDKNVNIFIPNVIDIDKLSNINENDNDNSCNKVSSNSNNINDDPVDRKYISFYSSERSHSGIPFGLNNHKHCLYSFNSKSIFGKHTFNINDVWVIGKRKRGVRQIYSANCSKDCRLPFVPLTKISPINVEKEPVILPVENNINNNLISNINTNEIKHINNNTSYNTNLDNTNFIQTTLIDSNVNYTENKTLGHFYHNSNNNNNNNNNINSQVNNNKHLEENNDKMLTQSPEVSSAQNSDELNDKNTDSPIVIKRTFDEMSKDGTINTKQRSITLKFGNNILDEDLMDMEPDKLKKKRRNSKKNLDNIRNRLMKKENGILNNSSLKSEPVLIKNRPEIWCSINRTKINLNNLQLNTNSVNNSNVSLSSEDENDDLIGLSKPKSNSILTDVNEKSNSPYLFQADTTIKDTLQINNNNNNSTTNNNLEFQEFSDFEDSPLSIKTICDCLYDDDEDDDDYNDTSNDVPSQYFPNPLEENNLSAKNNTDNYTIDLISHEIPQCLFEEDSNSDNSQKKSSDSIAMNSNSENLFHLENSPDDNSISTIKENLAQENTNLTNEIKLQSSPSLALNEDKIVELMSTLVISDDKNQSNESQYVKSNYLFQTLKLNNNEMSVEKNNNNVQGCLLSKSNNNDYTEVIAIDGENNSTITIDNVICESNNNIKDTDLNIPLENSKIENINDNKTLNLSNEIIVNDKSDNIVNSILNFTENHKNDDDSEKEHLEDECKFDSMNNNNLHRKVLVVLERLNVENNNLYLKSNELLNNPIKVDEVETKEKKTTSKRVSFYEEVFVFESNERIPLLDGEDLEKDSNSSTPTDNIKTNEPVIKDFIEILDDDEEEEKEVVESSLSDQNETVSKTDNDTNDLDDNKSDVIELADEEDECVSEVPSEQVQSKEEVSKDTDNDLPVIVFENLNVCKSLPSDDGKSDEENVKSLSVDETSEVNPPEKPVVAEKVELVSVNDVKNDGGDVEKEKIGKLSDEKDCKFINNNLTRKKKVNLRGFDGSKNHLKCTYRTLSGFRNKLHTLNIDNRMVYTKVTISDQDSYKKTKKESFLSNVNLFPLKPRGHGYQREFTSTGFIQLQQPRIILQRLSPSVLKRYGYTRRFKSNKLGKMFKNNLPLDYFNIPSYDGAADLSSSDTDSDSNSEFLFQSKIISSKKRKCLYQDDEIDDIDSEKPSTSYAFNYLNKSTCSPLKKRMLSSSELEITAASPQVQAQQNLSSSHQGISAEVTSSKGSELTGEFNILNNFTEDNASNDFVSSIDSNSNSSSSNIKNIRKNLFAPEEKDSTIEHGKKFDSAGSVSTGNSQSKMFKRTIVNIKKEKIDVEISESDDEEDTLTFERSVTDNLQQRDVSRQVEQHENENDNEGDESDLFNMTLTQFINNQTNEQIDSKDTVRSCEKSVIITPKFDPPTRKQIVETMDLYNIPSCRNVEPFFSNQADVPEKKELVNKFLKVPGKGIADLPNFKSSLEGVVGINLLRRMKINESNLSQDILKSKSIKSKLASRDPVVITPLLLPPSRADVVKWLKARDYLKKQKEKEQNSNKVSNIVNNQNLEIKLDDNSIEKSSFLIEEDERSKLFTTATTTTDITTIAGATTTITANSSENTSLVDPSLLSILEKSKLFNNTEESKVYALSHGQIECASNSPRSNVSHENRQKAKALIDHQFITILCVEVHVITRDNLLPDPEHDAISALFYAIQNDVPSSSTVNPLEHGVIAVAEAGASKLGYCFGSKFPFNLQLVTNEKELFDAFIDLIMKNDPEILIGWEIESLSWGYIFNRAKCLGINLAKKVSRIPDNQCKWQTEEGLSTDLEVLAEVKLPGRIVLDIWRIMRSEMALLSYSFENVMYHVLNERLPCPSFKALTDWWTCEMPVQRWKVVQHYSIKVLGILKIIEQLDIIGRTSEHARLFGIQFFEVFSRGSQFRVESIMLRLAKPLNYIAVSPSPIQRASMRAMEALPLIMEPESMFYSDPVIVLDFQSLYPSIIIAHNYCFSTCLGRIEHIGQSDPFEFGASVLRVTKNTALNLKGKINYAPCGVAYVKPEVRLGILPRMLTEILETRFMVKKAMKDHDPQDKLLQKVLHSRQHGLKYLANVTYGYTAANFSGRMPCIELGDSVISKAKETLERAIKLVETTAKWGARVVYGDTDSLFILIPGKSKEQAFKIGHEIADEVTASNLSPIKLKFEKILYPAILQTKKRYCGYMYETEDQKEPKFLAKGIETVRRDGCPAVSKILEKSLKILFDTKDVSLVKQFVMRQMNKVLSGTVSLQDLTFAKEFRGLRGYKEKACVPALELTRRLMKKDPRMIPRRGERVPYVIVAGAPNQALIQCVKSPWEVINNPGFKINGIYYVTRAIIPPLNRCFNLMGVDVNTWYKELPHRMIISNPTVLPNDKQKQTISQYFGTVVCVSCGRSSLKGICQDCSSNPTDTIITLNEKLNNLERINHQLLSICHSCTGRTEFTVQCNSLDCPILYRRVNAQREFTQGAQINKIIQQLSPLEF